MLGQDALALGICFAHDHLDLVVDGTGDLLGIGLRLLIVAPDEHLAAARIGHGAECVAHAVFGDHVADDPGRALEIVGRAGRDVAHAELLCHAPAEEADDRFEHLVARVVLLVVLRQTDGHAARRAARDDRNEVDGVLRGQDVHRDGVARLVDGSELFLVLRDDAAVLLRAGDDFNERVLEILHRDDAAALACRKERALVEQVRKVSPGESGGRLGEGCKIDVVGQRLVAGMYLQDGLAAAPIRAADVDLPVETAGAEQRRVENVLPVGRGDDDDALVGREAVHLDEQLVQRLFALIVSAAKARASAAAHGVDLVDEDDGGGDLLGLLEQVAHAARADADVQLHKVRAGN